MSLKSFCSHPEFDTIRTIVMMASFYNIKLKRKCKVFKKCCLFILDGRVSLCDLAQSLNVDYEHIENVVSVISKQSPTFILFNAELITRFVISLFWKHLFIFEIGIVFHSNLVKERQ